MTLSEQPLLWGVIAFVALESFCFIKIVPWYYRFGLLIFRYRATAYLPKREPPDSHALEFRHDDSSGVLVCRDIGEDRIAFRTYARDRRGVLMRGLLRFDRASGAVEGVGFANWSVLGMIAGVLVVLLRFEGWEDVVMGLAGLAVFAVMYLFEARRHTEIVNIAASAWSTPQVADTVSQGTT